MSVKCPALCLSQEKHFIAVCIASVSLECITGWYADNTEEKVPVLWANLQSVWGVIETANSRRPLLGCMLKTTHDSPGGIPNCGEGVAYNSGQESVDLEMPMRFIQILPQSSPHTNLHNQTGGLNGI